MAGRTRKKRTQSYILIDDGFDEFEVVTLLSRFRREGLAIKSISLFNQLVYSQLGVGLKADLRLGDVPAIANDQTLVILPAGGQNGEALRHDARVKQWLQALCRHHGKIAVTDHSSLLKQDIEQQLDTQAYLPQAGEELGDFVDSLAGRAAVGAW